MELAAQGGSQISGDYGASDELQEVAEPQRRTSGQELSFAATSSETDDSNELVKQHMKIAEEAVAGWEKAEAEVAAVKEKLEAALQQKLAAEDKASHLDGALKQCMKQLRHVRDEQEQKIQDAVLKKTKEWEKSRADMEAKLADAVAENQAMAESLKQQAKTALESADSERNQLRARLGVVEKENSRLRNELHALGRELDLRNKEREFNRKASEASEKQNLERVKKIAKLEEECQRLRLLAKSRLPNVAALSQKKPETDAVSGRDGGDKNRRRSPYRRNMVSTSLLKSEEIAVENGVDAAGLREENKLLSGRLVAMEEETKSLKALLAKRDSELQEARLMCARTAKKLWTDEHQDSQSCSQYSSKSACSSLPGSCVANSIEKEAGEAEEGCAESWASALIAELDQFKQEKKVHAPENLRQSLCLDELMDDFAEMEKLASLPTGDVTEDFEKSQCAEGKTEPLGDNEDKLCADLKQKLAYAEGQLDALKAKQSSSEATIMKLQQLLATRDASAEGKKSFFEAMEAAEIENAAEEGDRVRQPATDLVMTASLPYSDSSTPLKSVDSAECESEFSALGAQLAAAVRKVLDIAEGIAQTDYNFAYPQWLLDTDCASDEEGVTQNASPGKQWKRSGLDSCVESLVNLCNSLVQGKVDIIDFIAEVASALDWLVGLTFSLHDKSPDKAGSLRSPQGRNGLMHCNDCDVSSTRNTPVQVVKASHMEEAKALESQDTIPDQSSVSNLSFRFSEASTHEEELCKSMSENAALREELEIEARKIDGFESEILQLKMENNKLEENYKISLQKLAELDLQLHEANGRAQNLKSELLDAESRSSDLQSRLGEALDKIESLESTIADLESCKLSLECQLCSCKDNAKALENKVFELEEELKEKIICYSQVEKQLEEVRQQQNQQEREGNSLPTKQGQSGLTADEELARLKKEQEMAAAAEKLAECQQTILALGKQLKALGAPTEVIDASFSIPFNRNKKTANEVASCNTNEVVSCESEASDHYTREGGYEDEASSVSSWATGSQRGRREGGGVHVGSSRPYFSSSHSSGGGDGGGATSSASSTTTSFAEGLSDQQQPPAALRRGAGHPTASARFNGTRQAESQAIIKTHRLSLQQGEPDETHRDPHHYHHHQHHQHHQQEGMAVPSSPLRSPARFLSLRSSRNNNSGNDLDDKHGSGLSRFFAKTTRSGRG